MGKALSTDRNTKSPLEIKISTEENSNHRGVDLGTESRSRRSLRMGKLFRRERERDMSVLMIDTTDLHGPTEK
jgi:hypothetical protein